MRGGEYHKVEVKGAGDWQVPVGTVTVTSGWSVDQIEEPVGSSAFACEMISGSWAKGRRGARTPQHLRLPPTVKKSALTCCCGL